MAAMIAHRFLS